MWLGDHVVAQVWSFSNDTLDIPYRIMREGLPKKEGGKGVKWSCTCPSFANRGGYTCKHLITLREEARNGSLLEDKRFQVSDFGKEILKLVE